MNNFNQTLIDLLDEALDRANPKPKGIQVSPELFNALNNAGRLVIRHFGFTRLDNYYLDEKYFVMKTDLPENEPFRFPPATMH